MYFRINACIQDISNLFGGIENLDKDFAIFNTDDESIEFQDMLKKLVRPVYFIFGKLYSGVVSENF